VLEGLDAVPWDQLTHASGTAKAVPDQLRRLAKGDADALHELFGSIWHQGTVYEATSHAVPFLVEILARPEADTAGILGLLGCILRAYEDAHPGLWSEVAQASPERIEKRARERRNVERAVAAVLEHAETIAHLASDPRVEVRRNVIWLLIVPVFPTDIVARTVGQALAAEQDALALCGYLFALGLHSLPTPTALDLDDPRPIVRVGLSAVRVRAAADAPEPGTLAVLAEAVSESFDELSRSIWAADADFLHWLLYFLNASWPTQLTLLARWSQAESSDLRLYAGGFIADEVGLFPERGAEAVPLLERWLSAERDPAVVRTIREALEEARGS